jgi:hypothetical protein
LFSHLIFIINTSALFSLIHTFNILVKLLVLFLILWFSKSDTRSFEFKNLCWFMHRSAVSCPLTPLHHLNAFFRSIEIFI